MKYIKKFKIFESVDNNDCEAIMKIIERDCSKFLDDIIKNDVIFFRGVSSISGMNEDNLDIWKKRVRKDRVPKDMDREISKKIDDEFRKKFGDAPRSEAAFATTNASIAYDYGEAMIFFAIGDYNSYWGYKVDDLYTYIRDLKENEEEYFTENFDIIIKELVDKYIKNDLSGIKNQEVSFVCDEYYLVPIRYLDCIRNYLGI